MDSVSSYLNYVLIVAPFMCYTLAFLHLTKKVNPSPWVGYSAKGQLMFGIGFTFVVSSLWSSSGSNIGVVLAFFYVAIVIYAVYLEAKAKSNLEKGKFNNAT